jgi:DNA-binding protein YbaB
MLKLGLLSALLISMLCFAGVEVGNGDRSIAFGNGIGLEYPDTLDANGMQNIVKITTLREDENSIAYGSEMKKGHNIEQMKKEILTLHEDALVEKIQFGDFHGYKISSEKSGMISVNYLIQYKTLKGIQIHGSIIKKEDLEQYDSLILSAQNLKKVFSEREP